MKTSLPSARPGRKKWRILGWLVLTVCTVLFLAPHPELTEARSATPQISGTLELKLTLSDSRPGRCVPLITTGQPEAGACLFIRHTDGNRIVIGYDSWGIGGPVSSPIVIEPGRTEDLLVMLPEMNSAKAGGSMARGPLRVDFGGRTVLEGNVRYHRPQPLAVYFGENPIGGTVTNDFFHGRITTRSGRLLHDHPYTLRSRLRRAVGWLRGDPVGAAILTTITGLVWLATAVFTKRLRALPKSRMVAAGETGSRVKPHLVFAVTATGVLVLFSAVISGWSFNLMTPESFGRFYDDQTASLLRGRLDVPPEALGSEAFLVDGKVYGYFGPTPALLRIPLNLAGFGAGRLSRIFMVIQFAACLAAAYALLIHAARCAGGPGAWPARRHVALMMIGAGMGSSLFFLGSRAYVYHEAILCGAAFALWSVWATLRWLQNGGHGRWWVAALLCGVLSVHSRPPTGLFALATLGCAAAFLLYRALRSQGGPRAAGAAKFTLIGILSVLGVLSFNAISYLKFRSFDGAPLRYHVQYGPERLANIEGRNFHLSNVPYGLAGYVWRPNVVLRSTFPYLYVHGTNPTDFPGSRIDLAENTLALPWAMPILTLLAALAFGVMWLRWPEATVPLAVLAGGLAPMAAALLAAVAQSHRYTADFVPFLIAAAAFGLAGTDALSAKARRWWLALTALLTPVAVALTLAITLHYQGEGVWGVSDEIKARYLAMRRWSDHALGFKP